MRYVKFGRVIFHVVLRAKSREASGRQSRWDLTNKMTYENKGNELNTVKQMQSWQPARIELALKRKAMANRLQ